MALNTFKCNCLIPLHFINGFWVNAIFSMSLGVVRSL